MFRILNPAHPRVKRNAIAAVLNGVKNRKSETFNNYHCLYELFHEQLSWLFRCTIHQSCQTKPERFQDFIACRKEGQNFSILLLVLKNISGYLSASLYCQDINARRDLFSPQEMCLAEDFTTGIKSTLKCGNKSNKITLTVFIIIIIQVFIAIYGHTVMITSWCHNHCLP